MEDDEYEGPCKSCNGDCKLCEWFDDRNWVCECGDPECMGYWVDPAGGVHTCGEEDPAKMYE